MSIKIFYHQNNAREEWLDINDDGGATYTCENDGYRFMRRWGPERKEQKMTADEAKRRFPGHSKEIDLALAQLGGPNKTS